MHIRLYDSKGNLHREIFCPSEVVALYTLLTITLRFLEVLLLDREGDDLIYDFKGNKMIKNITSKLSERYKICVTYQVIGMIQSWLSNRENKIKDIIHTNET